jgi:hypothetical protein
VTLDAGLGYYSQGAAWNPAVFNGTQELISKQTNGSKWLWSPNKINQSVIGIQMSEPIGYDWSDYRNGGSRVRPDFRRIGQFAAIASHEQWQGADPAERERRFEPGWPVG